MSITHALRRRALRVAAALMLAAAALAGVAAPAHAAPAAPGIELLTNPPQAGSPVELRFTAVGAVAFHYGVNFSGPQHRVEADTEAVVSFTAAPGRTTVYAWAEDADGNLSPQNTIVFYSGGFIAPVPIAAWRLDGNGVDDANGAGALSLPATASWEPNAAPAPHGRSLGFDGTCAPSANATAFRTDAAFWVAAWVRIDTKDADQVLISKAGQHRTGFSLGYDAETDRFTVTVADRDAATGQREFVLSSTTAPETGVWTHVSVTSNPDSQQLRLYRDGVLDAESGVGFSSGGFTGPVTLGCDAHSGTAAFTGALTHVGLWRGLPDQAYLDAAYRGDLMPGIAADWRLRGDGSDAAAPGHALDLPASLTWDADQYGRGGSAASFDGASCARVGDRVLSSQSDFSVEAWVKLDSLATDQTVLSQDAEHRDAFSLGYDSGSGSWQFALPSDNGKHPEWAVATAAGAPAAGEWTHLVAAVNTDRSGSGHLALYVNGVLDASTELAFAPLAGKDLVSVGCSANGEGETANHLDGAVSGLRLWRGVLDQAAADFSYRGNPPATGAGSWSFMFGEVDDSGLHPLEIHGTEGVDWFWEDVFEGQIWTGLQLDGTGNGYASTAGPVATTDESFTVMTSVKLADKSTDQTIVAQAGDGAPGFELGYDAALDRFHFTMASADGTEAKVIGVDSPQSGTWYNLTVLYDLKSGQLRLYVDGLPSATAEGPAAPQGSDGPLTLGLATDTSGAQWNPLNGSLSDTHVWNSLLTENQIRIWNGI